MLQPWVNLKGWYAGESFLKCLGPYIQHISGVANIVADTLITLPSTPNNKYDSCTRKALCRANELFTIGRLEKNDDCFPLNLLIVQIEQQK